MTYTDIMQYIPVNDTDAAHVREIADSIKANGWIGMPILVCNAFGGSLVTGSHRLAALRLLASEDWDFDPDILGDIAEDVSGEVEKWCIDEDEDFDHFPHDNLSAVFCGSWVEQYKDELIEW